MGRTVAAAIMVLVGLGVFVAPAQAQNEAIILDNVMYWWDHLNCQRIINAVNAIPDAVATGTPPHAVLTGGRDFHAWHGR